MSEEIIKVQGLAFAYEPGRPVLENVNLSVGSGERIAVMGANGAGKSTFFLQLNGVLQPETGSIYYKGRKLGRKDGGQLRRHVGFVFQDADHQIIASTVQAEVAFGPMNLKLSQREVETRVAQALAYMDLTSFRERPPHYLSGGEKKRVSIADIIAMKTEVILFDEPTAALDPLSGAMLERVLADLAQEGKTLLVSTHDVDFAYRWAKRIIIFDHGTILADGTVLDIFQKEEALKQAHLKKPEMLAVYETLLAKGLVKEGSYPRSASDLEKAMK